jgi:hypothetical protein
MKQPSDTPLRMLFVQVGQAWQEKMPGLLAVPFLAHRADQAAAAALAMVLDYYGQTTGGRRRLEHGHSEAWGAEDALPQQLSHEARLAGVEAAVACGNLLRLQEWLWQGVPVLVFPDAEIRGGGEPVAVVTGITRDRTAICLHYGNKPNQWLRAADFQALCGGSAFTAVPVAARQLAAHARLRSRPRHAASTMLELVGEPCAVLAA